MFDHIGQKIKNYVKTVFVIMAIGSIIVSCFVGIAVADAIWSDAGDLVGLLCMVITAAIGIGSAYLSVMKLYALGELVENSTILVELTRSMGGTGVSVADSSLKKMPEQSPSNANATPDTSSMTSYYWICPECKKENYRYIGTCGCGCKKPN